MSYWQGSVIPALLVVLSGAEAVLLCQLRLGLQ